MIQPILIVWSHRLPSRVMEGARPRLTGTEPGPYDRHPVPDGHFDGFTGLSTVTHNVSWYAARNCEP